MAYVLVTFGQSVRLVTHARIVADRPHITARRTETRQANFAQKRHLAAPKLVACNDPHIPPLPDSGDASAKPSIVVARSCEANFRHFQPAQARSATDTTDFWELTVG